MLLKNFNKLRDIYPSILYVNWDILKLACIYHDLGKMNTKFQNKLGARLKDNNREIDEIYHNFLSVAFIPKKKLKDLYSEQDIKILYQAVYYHHYRPKPDFKDLQVIIKEDLNQYWEDFNFEYIDKSEGLYSSFNRQLGDRITWENPNRELIYKYIVTKGLLNKLDYAASAHIPVEIENKSLQNGLDNFFQGRFEKNELQKYMIKNREENNIIIASTGIGKTEAALFWLGNNKGFFTLPLRVSINAIYDRVKDKIGFEDVALLHSNSYSEYLKRASEHGVEVDEDYYSKTKQLSMPLTICTLDQLIDFVFKYDGYEMKLATLAYSKLIIDEIQMYSPEMIAYLIVALKYITDLGGRFSIVTATLPGIFIDLLIKHNIPCSEPRIFLTDKVRHKIKVVESSLSLDDIANNFKGKKVLIIANTVKKAQEIFRELDQDDRTEEADINLLHSRYTKSHRREKEDKIMEMGKTDYTESGIWISTQIVEASLDIDFDILFTELSDLSGLFQRMGRIYRNRELHAGQDSEPNVYVYVGDDSLPSGISKSARLRYIDYEIFQYSKEEILKYDEKALEETDKIKMIENVYSTSRLEESSYLQTIEETIKYTFDIPDYYLEKNDRKLRDIITDTVIPLDVFENNASEINMLVEKFNDTNLKLSRGEKERIKNEIYEYTVDLPSYMTKGQDRQTIFLGKYLKIFIMEFNYDCKIGLTVIKREETKNSEDNFF